MKQESKSIFNSQKTIGSSALADLRSLSQIPVTRRPSESSPNETIVNSEPKGHTRGVADIRDTQSYGGSASEVIQPPASDALPSEAQGLYDRSPRSLPTPASTTRQYSQDLQETSPHAGFTDNLKRPRLGANGSFQPPPKKQRHRSKPTYVLDPSTFPTGIATITQPPSPLFFSHTQRQRPPLPSAFSSSAAAAAATMLNKAREGSSGVTTLRLARGSINNSSPPRAISSPGSWMSLGQGSTPRSPDPGSEASALQVLGSIGIIELLEQDPRLTFIVDLASTKNHNTGPLYLLFANSSLRFHEAILDMVMGKTDSNVPESTSTNSFADFKSWALSFVKTPVKNIESSGMWLHSFLYGEVTWTCSTLKNRLRVISGDSGVLRRRSGSEESKLGIFEASSQAKLNYTSSPLIEVSEPLDYFGDVSELNYLINSGHLAASPDPAGIALPPSDSGVELSYLSNGTPLVSKVSSPLQQDNNSSFDWTRLPMSSTLPSHIQFARSIDWASTSLGPIETWSFDLRAMCNLIMGSPNPAAIYWGSDYIAIYNEAYVLLAGNKHPALMGQSYKEAWAEIWDEIKDVFDSAIESGQATMKDDDCLYLMRNGYLEESYFSWSIVPLVGEDGSVVGLYNPAFEKTRRKIAERRMLTLREVGETTSAAREVKGFWGQVLKGLEYNEYDMPFAFLYSVSDESTDSDISSMHSGSLSNSPQCVLEGTLGVPKNHHTAITPLDLKTGEKSWAPYLRQSMKTNKPVYLTTADGTLSTLIADLEVRGFGDPCRSAVVCPIAPSTGDSILGFLVVGINQRRPYDDDYALFIQLLSRQLATSMASVCLFEEEIRRGRRAARLAALDRIELSKQLDMRTQEVAESETKFTRMAEMSPVGMFIANSLGQIKYSNETWWEMMRHNRENGVDTWRDSIKEEDRMAVSLVWEKLVQSAIPITHEFRVKAPWQDRNDNSGKSWPTWLLMSAYPETDSTGGLKSVFGSLTNISSQKFAEEFQKRRMEEAVELKRQQENFIDMTSHEMRNPLSAILQCADEITMSLSNYRNQDDKSLFKLEDIMDSSIDAAQTIALCAQHQKRIVDDILTLSKLDSALLLVTPVDVQPVSVVQRALKMFEGELETNGIRLEFQLERSYADLGIDWVKLDPSRLLQVLINLTTNAIKFTNNQEKRTITVGIGASKERPPTNTQGASSAAAGLQGVSYFPTRSTRKDMTVGEDWGSGDEIYIHFFVQDTGPGLDDEEKKLLFIRFSQTSPRTHVQYGGSGLGLFISRELTELQGGEIGVASERGVGSTFAFYVKGRQVAQPHNNQSSPSTALRGNSWNRTILTLDEVQKTAAARVPYKMAQPSQPERPSISTRSSSLERGLLRVLIVEDNLVNQRVLQKQLRNLGCVTHVANHGLEALETLKRSRFWKGQEDAAIELTVILMDLEMPEMDGLTCARTIRELEAEGTIVRHVPIIAVTANARMEQIEIAMAAGMDDVVSKPFRIPALIMKIEELVEKHGVDKSPPERE